MELTKAELRGVRDGWRRFLYRACPQLKENPKFTRQLLDHLMVYNNDFLDAFIGEPSKLDSRATDLAEFLRQAYASETITEPLYSVLVQTLNVRPVRLGAG